MLVAEPGDFLLRGAPFRVPADAKTVSLWMRAQPGSEPQVSVEASGQELGRATPGARWTPLRLDATALRGHSVRLRVRSDDAAGLQLALIGTVQRAPGLRVAKAGRDPKDPQLMHVVIQGPVGLAGRERAGRGRTRRHLSRRDAGAPERLRPGAGGAARAAQAHRDPCPVRGQRGLRSGHLTGARRASSAAAQAVIAHLDLDAFYAACELLDHPELRGVPLIVGGRPESRGVVATASYEARAFGVGSGMSSAEARRRCPKAVFVPPDHARYRERSQEVWQEVRRLCPRVEQVGIDEGYLDLSAMVQHDAARALLGALQAAVRESTGLGCSLGAGGSKTVAKIASDRRKPGGVVVVPPGQDRAFLAPLPLRLLPGVGPRAEERLRAAGCLLIGDLAALGAAELAATLPGKVGEELQRRAQGIDDRPVVVEPQEPVTISCEETFERDLVDRERMRSELELLSDRVWARLEHYNYRARTVTVKLRYPDFAIATRARTIEAPVESEAELARIAFELLDRALADRPAPVRLLGVGAGKLARDVELQLQLPLR